MKMQSFLKLLHNSLLNPLFDGTLTPNYNTNIKLLIMSTYKDWELYEVLPAGWKIDKHCGSPLFGYDFCTDGKSIINGGKRALVKTERKGLPTIQYVKNQQKEPSKLITKENFVFPSKTVNMLARKKFQQHILKEILFDLMVCEIEGWDKKEYIKELKTLFSSIDLSSSKKQSKNLTQLNLFSEKR